MRWVKRAVADRSALLVPGKKHEERDERVGQQPDEYSYWHYVRGMSTEYEYW